MTTATSNESSSNTVQPAIDSNGEAQQEIVVTLPLDNAQLTDDTLTFDWINSTGLDQANVGIQLYDENWNSTYSVVVSNDQTTYTFTGLPTDGRVWKAIVFRIDSDDEWINASVFDSITASTGGEHALEAQSAMDLSLAANESVTISGKKFESIHDQIALNVTGSETSTLIVEDCLFRDCNFSIKSTGVGTVKVTGVRFESVGFGMKVYLCNDLEFTFNEGKLMGMLDGSDVDPGAWSNNFIQVCETENLTRVVIEDNVCDNSADDRENIQTNTLREDYIAIYHSTYHGDERGSIQRNKLRGSVDHCESSSAGGIIFDQCSENYLVKDNTVVNTGQYLIGNANSNNNVMENNKGFISWQHDVGLRQHAKNPWGYDPGTVGGNVVGALNTTFGDGTAGTATWNNNVILAQRANESGTAYSYPYNYWEVELNNFDGNNFDASSNSGVNGIADPDENILPENMFNSSDDRYMSARRSNETS